MASLPWTACSLTYGRLAREARGPKGDLAHRRAALVSRRQWRCVRPSSASSEFRGRAGHRLPAGHGRSLFSALSSASAGRPRTVRLGVMATRQAMATDLYMRIAGTSKTFTVTAILMLADMGKLGLDEKAF